MSLHLLDSSRRASIIADFHHLELTAHFSSLQPPNQPWNTSPEERVTLVSLIFFPVFHELPLCTTSLEMPRVFCFRQVPCILGFSFGRSPWQPLQLTALRSSGRETRHRVPSKCPIFKNLPACVMSAFQFLPPVFISASDFLLPTSWSMNFYR